jgi:hypothetical protein
VRWEGISGRTMYSERLEEMIGGTIEVKAIRKSG